jgi:putative LysE/RhtB family amino acid efflux pump
VRAPPVDEMEALVQGVVIGLSVAAPPGPNAALCMNRTLAGGRQAGLGSGLGAASAHAVYAIAAVVGVGRASSILASGAGPARFGGGLVLVGLGLRLGLAGPRPRPGSPAGAYAVTFAVGLANPLTLLYFAAALALGAVPVSAGPLVVVGVFAGSAAWWAVLVQVVTTVGHRLDERRMVWANRMVAVVIAGFGVVAAASAL